MLPRPWFLLAAGLFALPAALLAPRFLPAAAAVAAAGVLCALGARWALRLAGLAALPVLLAAIPPRAAAPDWPRPGPVLVRGVVAGLVRDPEHGAVALQLRSGQTTVWLGCDGAVEAAPGDRVAVIAHLGAPPAPGLSPTLRAAAGGVRLEPAPASLPRVLHRARAACERALLELLPDERGAVLATLVLGRGTRAPRDVEQAHRATGLSHLLAVSGAHAAMLAFLLGLGGAGRGRRLGASRRHVAIALLLLFAYAGITGLEPPVVRAVVTYSLAALALRVGRPLGLASGLLVPALVTAVTAPAALLGPSFLLSYAAVFGLSLAPGRGGSRLGRLVLTPLRASFWATCTTAPLTLCFFGQIAPWTILLTPLLAPLVAVLLLLGLLAAVLGAIAAPLAAPLAPALGLGCEAYLAAVAGADCLPWTPLRARCLPEPWLLGVAALAAVTAGIACRGRLGVAVAVLVFAAPWFVPLPRARPARLTLLAVGHGQACLLETPAGERVAVDCGSLQRPLGAARTLAAALPVRVLDWLVVTHADQDHHNGVPSLLAQVEIRRALLPHTLADAPLAGLLRAHGAEVALLQPGQRLTPCAAVAVAAPRLPAGASRNDQSLWVRVEVAGRSVLLTGDAMALGTAAALAQDIAVPSDVLVLPHHGRANPTAPALLRTVRPRCCLASAAGADGETALGELARRTGADLWVTGLHGHLEVRFGPRPTVTAAERERALPGGSDR